MNEPIFAADPLDELRFNLHELCEVCDANAEVIIEMIEFGVLAPDFGNAPQEWRFSMGAARRSLKALRLQRDLQVNLSGAALVLELLDELEVQRRRLHRYETLFRAD